jgi:hypothetical protein
VARGTRSHIARSVFVPSKTTNSGDDHKRSVKQLVTQGKLDGQSSRTVTGGYAFEDDEGPFKPWCQK